MGDVKSALIEVETYVARETAEIQRLADLARDNGGMAIWGMATKGVVLSNLVPILGGVDSNPGKQGKFAAGSGASINEPRWLLDLPAGTPVLVMNPNYYAEIAKTAASLGAAVKLITA